MKWRFAAAVLLACRMISRAAPQAQLSPADEEFISVHFQAAKMAEDRANFAEAIDNYRRILDKHPSAVPEIYQNLGLVAYLGKRYSEAIDAFERGLKLRPGMVGSRLFLGASYVLLGRPEQALPHLRYAHKARPTTETAMYLGLALHGLRRYEQATPFFSFALPRSLNRDYFLHLLGVSYLKQSEQLSNALSLHFPESKHEHIMLAKIVDAQQLYQISAKEYLEAGKLDPMNAALFLPLARWLAVLGLDAAAEAAMERYRRLLPAERSAKLDRSDLPKRELADVGIKVDYLAELLALPEVSVPPAPQLTAEVNAEIRKRTASVGGAKWRSIAARISAAQWPEATVALIALPASPADPLRDFLLAAIWLLRDDALKADEIAAKLKPAPGYQADLLLLRWEISRQLSYQHFQQLAEEYPASAWTHFAKARNLEAQGKREALKEYQAAIAADPNLPEIRIALADFHASNSNLEEALALCRQELELNPFSVAAKLRLGRIHIGLRQAAIGMPYVEEALRYDAGDPDIHTDLGVRGVSEQGTGLSRSLS